MAKELRFDVTALDQASKTFARMAAAVEAFERRLDKLDNKRVKAEVEVDTDKADREIGRFATEMRRKVQAAVDSLPDIEIDADSSDADRALADIRRRMQELADKTIGVDLSAEEAIAEAQTLQRELDELGRTTADPRVRVDSAAASAQLAKVSGEVDKLDQKTATVKVKTDKSFSDATIDIALLGRSLASLAIPAAVVAGAPAIASLGSSAKTSAQSLFLIPAAATAAGLAVATLKVGFQGFGDAVGDDPKKAAEAMADMAPAARDAASAVQKLRPAWDSLRLDVQQRLFAGFGEQISKVGGTYLPILKDTLGDVAEGFGYGATQVSLFLQRAETVDTVRSMFSNLENTLENLTSRTLAPLTSAFVDMGAVGSEVLLEMSEGAGAAAERFATFIAQARQSGQLGVWIREGVDVLRQLGQVAGNVGSILGSIFDAADASGTSFLTTLVNATGRMREFFASAQGQSALVSTFESIRSVTAALLPGIQAIGRAIGEIVVNREASGALEALAAAFSALVVAAAPVVVTISGMVSRAITPLAAALGFLAPVIGPVVGGLLAMKAASAALSFTAAITGVKALSAAATGAVSSLNTLRSGAATAATAATTAGSSASAAGAAMRSAASGAVVVGTATSTAGSKAADAGGKFDGLKNKMSGLRTAAGGLAGAIPLIGAALYGLVAGAQAGRESISDMDAAVAAGGPTLDAFRQKLSEQNGEWEKSDTWIGRLINTTNQWTDENITGVATLDQLNEKIAEQQRRLDEAARSAGVSRASFDAMRASTEASDAATGKFNDNLRLIAPALAGMKDGVSPTREMSVALQGLGTDANTAAVASGLAAQRLGGIDAGAKAAGAAMAASRDSFIQAAVGAGMTEEAAGKLADQLGLIPSKVETEFRSNAAAVNLDIQQVADKVRDVPPGKTITVNSITDSARQQLEQIGFTVKTLPDGRVEVTANTEAAKGQLRLLESAARNPVNKDIDLNTLDAHTKARVLNDEASKPENKQVLLEIATAQRQAQLLSQAASRPENKGINLDTLDAHTKARVLSDEARRPENKQVDVNLGNALPAVQGLGSEARRPESKPVDANVTGGLGAVDLLKSTAQQPAVMPLDADAARAQGKITGVVETARGSVGTMIVDANPDPATGKITGTVQMASGQTGTITVDANQTPANGKIQGVVTYGNGQRTTVTVNANDLATPAINRIPRSGTTVWTIRYVTVGSGVSGAAANAARIAGSVRATGAYATPRATGAYATAYASGGWRSLRPMSAARAEIVPPNQPRIIGDRMRGDEAFVPVDQGDARAQSILRTLNTAMGWAQVPLEALRPMADGGMLTAARLILDRMNSRQQLFEDWTWRGAPSVVGQYNDALHNARERAGFSYARGREWLTMYVRQTSTPATRPVVTAPQSASAAAAAAMKARVQAATSASPSPTVQIDGVAELRSLLAEARVHSALLRGVQAGITAQGYSADMLDRLDRLVSAVNRGAPSAQRAANARDLATFGGVG